MKTKKEEEVHDGDRSSSGTPPEAEDRNLESGDDLDEEDDFDKDVENDVDLKATPASRACGRQRAVL